LTSSICGSRRLGVGFTLIELMLVIFIVGMLATGVSMVSTSDRLPKQITQEARMLQASVRQMQSLAMTHQQIYGLSFNDGGWRLYVVEPNADYMQWGVNQAQESLEQQPLERFSGINNDKDDKTDSNDIPWMLIKKKNSRHELSKQLELHLFLGDKESEILGSDDLPQILFSAQGDVTPFFLLLRGVNSDVEVMLEVTNAGEVVRMDVGDPS
jgi:type II secretion system protein H